MSERLRNGSGSSSSSLNSIFLETEDDQAIASILAEDENLKADNRLGKRLSHLDSIPVRCHNHDFLSYLFPVFSLNIRNMLYVLLSLCWNFKTLNCIFLGVI